MNKLFRTLTILLLLTLGTHTVWAQEALQVAPSGSLVGFSIRNFISQTSVVSKDFDGTHKFSPVSAQSNSVRFEVEVASIDTGTQFGVGKPSAVLGSEVTVSLALDFRRPIER